MGVFRDGFGLGVYMGAFESLPMLGTFETVMTASIPGCAYFLGELTLTVVIPVLRRWLSIFLLHRLPHVAMVSFPLPHLTCPPRSIASCSPSLLRL